MTDPFYDTPDDPDALEETVADVELEEVLDRVEPETGPTPAKAHAEEEDLGGFDPEAGQTRIGGRTTITGHITSEAGLFVIGLMVALAGSSVLIYALVMQTTRSLIIAGIVAPPALIWAFLKWRRWLGGAPYFYRLLLSLNEREAAEEIMAEHQERQQKRIAKRIAELEAKGVEVED